MAFPLIPLFWVAGIATAGWAARQGGDAAESATQLAKWGAVAGAVYVSYRALQSAGALK